MLVATEPPVLAPDRIDGPDRPAGLIDLVDQRHRGGLVGHRDVAADEARLFHATG